MGYTLGLILVALFTFHILWACGWIPGIGGFALAADMSQQISVTKDGSDKRQSKIEDALATLERIQVRQSLDDAMKKECQAIEQNNQEALDAANATLDNLSPHFYELFHYTYGRQSCDTVLIKAH
jgi:hypothetical protein